MNSFFLLWNNTDSLIFVLIVVACVRYLVDKKISTKLFYVLMLSWLITLLLKAFIQLPRPCGMDPTIGVICIPTPGFPSVGTSGAMIYAGIIFLETKKWLYRSLSLIFAFFITFSRIYLGVHFFLDAIGGLVVGALLVLAYWKLFPRLEKYWKWLIFLFPLIILSLVPIFRNEPFMKALIVLEFWISLGFALGLLLAEKKEKMAKWGVRIVQTLCILIVLILCNFGGITFPKFSAAFAIVGGFWLSYLGAKIGKWILNICK